MADTPPHHREPPHRDQPLFPFSPFFMSLQTPFQPHPFYFGYPLSSARVAIVTGSFRGIGCTIALWLAKDDPDVVINNQSNAAKAQEVVGGIQALTKDSSSNDKTTPRGAIAVQGDVSDMVHGQHLIDETLRAFDWIDVVVFNAARINYKVLEEVTPEDYEKAFKPNVDPHLKKQEGARVYYSTKGAVEEGRK
ncbi:hypothetical protein BC939DRAFT_477363 [Gamsiella multidivaricata]|uniref:uncharacterized protein n=1 Tax=Gamsiella multidivaricata TaxID=101098 RepID=UPI00221F4D54|nr:uncharacterized protein BC939DRAFT_477363 [Gamsiella multidivaricata]KAI7823239.1 hypothetical protein BC939DRAFT_477363 [Gamsiella multidivaricata]